MLPHKPELRDQAAFPAGGARLSHHMVPAPSGPPPVWIVCHVVVCPLEVELGPQSLPWLLLLFLRNSVIVPGLLFKRIWAGEGGRNDAHLSDYEKAGVGPSWSCLGVLRGKSQVKSGSIAVPIPLS